MEVLTDHSPEKDQYQVSVRFESGKHPQTTEAATQIEKRFTSGNLDAHYWNQAVGERIASYAYDAPQLLLTIDGLEPQKFPWDTQKQEASYVWLSSPARPNKLNRTGEIYIAKGDISTSYLPNATITEPEQWKRLRPLTDSLLTKQVNDADEMLLRGLVEEAASIFGFGAMLWATGRWLPAATSKAKMSRRTFLNRALVASGALATASTWRGGISQLTADIPNEQTEQFFQVVANVLRPRLARSPFIDGRTALLLAKGEDAQREMTGKNQLVNVVVMGDGHVDIARTYLQDTQARQAAIEAYSKELLTTAQEVYASFFHTSQQALLPQVASSILDYISQVEIVKVTDPWL